MEVGPGGKPGRAGVADEVAPAQDEAGSHGHVGEVHVDGVEAGKVLEDDGHARDDARPSEDHAAGRCGMDGGELRHGYVHARVDARLGPARGIDIPAAVAEARAPPRFARRQREGAVEVDGIGVFLAEAGIEGFRLGDLFWIDRRGVYSRC